MKFEYLIFIIFLGFQITSAQSFKVKWVNDGDTIILTNKKKIRYIGINTPEVDHGNIKSEPFAHVAKKANVNMVMKSFINLKYDFEKKDRYGRILAYVFLKDGNFVNAELIKKGLAHCLTIKPNIKYKELFLRLQRTAMDKKIGIWRDFKNIKNRYIGNKNSFRFHKATCKNGNKTSLRNIINFSSRFESFYEGYAPCKKCNP
ncbi:MAG: hypothetical protein GY714_30530 [Desulfobacterales bacterium]|nr:hypothetical protein [Desulfobacterales bacterium]